MCILVVYAVKPVYVKIFDVQSNPVDCMVKFLNLFMRLSKFHMRKHEVQWTCNERDAKKCLDIRLESKR